jgi:hypothetical protein
MPHIEEMNHEQLLAFATKLKDEYNITHNELMWIAAELAWATDGTLAAVVRHVKELVRRRNETIEAKDTEIADLKRKLKFLKNRTNSLKKRMSL